MASDSDATEWEKTRRGLLAPLQLAVVDDSEERGLDLLTDTVVNSNACALLEADIPFADITRITRSYTKPKMEVLNSHSVVVCKIDDEVEALHLPWPPRRLPDALVGTSSPSCQTGGVTIRLKPSGSPPRS